MKKILFTLSFVLFAFVLSAQDFNHVLVSKQKVNNKAAITYVNYGSDFYLTFRDGKRQFDYKLTPLGNHMTQGYISYAFKATLSTNVEVTGLKFYLVSVDGSGFKKDPPKITMEADGKEIASFEVEGV